MKSKKSQIVMFILFGLILLISLSFVIYLINNESKNTEIDQVSRLSFDFVPIRDYVESCIENVGRDEISIVGLHGGYFSLPIYSTKNYLTKTAYYFYIDKSIMPSKNRIEQELSKYIDKELFFCINNFADFKEQGFKIEQGKINTRTAIEPDSIRFKVEFPLSVKKGASQIRFDSFTKSINNVRLGVIYNVSKEIINEQMEDFDSICLSCIINLVIENDLHVDLQSLDNSTILFTITDNNTIIDGFPYKFIFANKYREVSCRNIPTDWADEKRNEFLLDCAKSQIKSFNYTLKINELPVIEAVVGILFTYDVDAVGANVNFTDYTNLFDINKSTGLIKFIPNEEDIGEHVVWVSVVDSLGNEDFESFELSVIKSP